MARTPPKGKPTQRKDHRFRIGILIFLFGVIFFIKVRNVAVPYVSQIPDDILMWATAIGCIIGGGYMMFKGLTRRKYFI